MTEDEQAEFDCGRLWIDIVYQSRDTQLGEAGEDGGVRGVFYYLLYCWKSIIVIPSQAVMNQTVTCR